MDQELEDKVQQLHVALKNVERLTANVEHLECDNNYLTKTLEEKSKELEEAQKNEGKGDQLQRQLINELRQELDAVHDAEAALKESNAHLQKRLEQKVLECAAFSANISVGAAEADAEEIADLSAKVDGLEKEKRELQSKLVQASSQIEQGACEKSRLIQEMEEKDEEILCMESQFSAQCNINQSQREEIQQLKVQLESKTGEVDTGRKGNSLFSEVDDRRVAAEKKLVQALEQTRSLEEKMTRETQENRRLKNQLAFARQTSKKGMDENAMRSLQNQVTDSMKKVKDLTEKLVTLESSKNANTVQEQWRASTNTSDDDKSYISFLESLIRTKSKEVKDIQRQSQASRMECVRTELNLTQANNEIITLRHELDKAKLQNSHLSFTLNELRHKYEDNQAETKMKGGKQPVSVGETAAVTTAPETLPAHTNPLRNISNLDENTRTSCAPDQTDISLNTGKKALRLRDVMFSPKDQESRGSRGVKISPEVTVMNCGGDQSMALLRGDDQSAKPRRVRDHADNPKLKSVTSCKASESENQPADCNQQ